MPFKACPCGSGLDSYWYNDARGIPLFRGCTKCYDEKASRYRTEVLNNPDYDACEDIEPDGETPC